MLTDGQFYAGAVLVALVTILLWWNAARQSDDLQKSSDVVADLAARLATPAAMPIEQGHIANLGSLTSAQLRQRVAAITAKMRRMEARFRSMRDREIHGDRSDFQASSRRLIAQSTAQATEWRTEGQPEAVALWEEIGRRVYGEPPEYDRDASVALQHGMLAGVSPLSDAALSLERLARLLPE